MKEKTETKQTFVAVTPECQRQLEIIKMAYVLAGRKKTKGEIIQEILMNVGTALPTDVRPVFEKLVKMSND